MSAAIAGLSTIVCAVLDFILLWWTIANVSLGDLFLLVSMAVFWTLVLCVWILVAIWLLHEQLQRSALWGIVILPPTTIVGVAGFSLFFLSVWWQTGVEIQVGLLAFFVGVGYGLLYSTVGAYFNYGFPSTIRIWGYALLFLIVALILVGLISELLQSVVEDSSTRLIIGSVLGYFGFVFAALHFDDYYLSRLRMKSTGPIMSIRLPRVTQLQLTPLDDWLFERLCSDWQSGLETANTIWHYSRQRQVVASAVNRTFSQTESTKLLPKLEMIVLNGLGDEIHRFQGHASGGRLDEFVGAITLRNLRLAGTPSEFALNTPVSWRVLDSSSSPQISFHTVIGAFQLMREGKFGEAADELRRLGAKASSENYEETIGMWDALHTLRAVEHILSLRLDTLPICGSLPYRSHRAICRIIDLLFESLHFAALYSHCETLDNRQIIGEELLQMLTEIKAELVTGHSTSTAQAGVQNSTPNVTPSNESMIEIYRNTLVEIVDSWQEMLRTPPINNSVQVIADKVINPFLYDEPLRDRDVYCPRRRIESRLSRAWTNKHLHPIELVGPTLIGKTSFIQVITDQFPAIVFETVSFEHLNTHINPLARIAYAISDALTTNYPELRPKFPQITKEPFRQVEHLVRQRCMNQDDANLWGMVLVLDDFDYADRIVDRLQYQQFIHFLFHLSESLSNFGLVVLRTVGQNGYFDRHRSDSLRSSFPLRLTAFRSGRASPPYRTVFYQFLNLQLLGQDATDFPCRFSRAAEHRIVVLTGGHPFLIQLIAWNTVEYFLRVVNDELEAADPPRNQDPLFSVKDVNTILESDMFLDGLSYYAHRLLAAFGEHRRLVYAILQMYVNYNRPLHFREIRDALPTELSATNVDEIDLVLDGLCEQGVLVRSPTRARYRPRFELVTRLAQRVDLRDF